MSGGDSLDLKEKARQLPFVPGVYMMKDNYDNIIYVGKSKKLRSRVSSYFINSKHHSPKVVKMVKSIRDFDYIVTDTEFEAFLLECKLINSLKPMYNKLMKSPEGYVYIKITINENYPDILISKENHQDGCLYFGPYSSHNTVERAIDGVKESCRIKCNTIGLKKRSKCLNFALGLCMGMCQGDGVKEEYNKVINRIIDLLNGKDNVILGRLEIQMTKAAEDLEFIEAAKYRDYIGAIDYLISKQKVANYSERNRNIAVLEALYNDEIKFFLIKGNKVIYKEKLSFKETSYEEIKYKIIRSILACLSDTPSGRTRKISKEEIDEAQIIYSYLKNNKACNYTVIPNTWIVKKQDAKLGEAVDKICGKYFENNK